MGPHTRVELLVTKTLKDILADHGSADGSRSLFWPPCLRFLVEASHTFVLHLCVSAKAFGIYDPKAVVASTRHMDRNGWKQCLTGGDISLIRARDEILSASWLAPRLYGNLNVKKGYD